MENSGMIMPSLKEGSLTCAYVSGIGGPVSGDVLLLAVNHMLPKCVGCPSRTDKRAMGDQTPNVKMLPAPAPCSPPSLSSGASPLR